MIRKLLVVQHEACLPIFEMDLNSTIKVDPSILCDFLQAETPVKVIEVDKNSTITKIKYYGFEIISASYTTYSVYLFSERELEKEVENKVLELAQWFNVIFGFESTEGEYSKEFSNYYKDSIRRKVTELFDLWLLYPLEVNHEKLKKTEIKDDIDTKIISNIEENIQTSVIKLLHDFQEYEEDEEILQRLFKLVNSELLVTGTSDQFTQTFFSLDTNYI
jgi:hypothetical protein